MGQDNGDREEQENRIGTMETGKDRTDNTHRGMNGWLASISTAYR